jgi:hypothetical protein
MGKPKHIHLCALADRIKTKLATWKGSLLSILGRVQLARSIIHGMPTYSFQVYLWPVSLPNEWRNGSATLFGAGMLTLGRSAQFPGKQFVYLTKREG